MTNLLIIPVQTVNDVITNSSSELFILNTNKSCEEVNSVLKTFTRGFMFPEVFNLEEYRKWREKYRSDSECYNCLFETIDGWFKDPKDKEDLLYIRRDFLFDPYEIIISDGFSFTSYSSTYKEPIHDEFIKYLNNNWDKVKDVIIEEYEKPVSKLTWEIFSKIRFWIKYELEDIANEFLEQYSGPIPTVWEISDEDNIENLDNKILVLSNEDNSIPYDTWNKINELFNGRNIHLG